MGSPRTFRISVASGWETPMRDTSEVVMYAPGIDRRRPRMLMVRSQRTNLVHFLGRDSERPGVPFARLHPGGGRDINPLQFEKADELPSVFNLLFYQRV